MPIPGIPAVSPTLPAAPLRSAPAIDPAAGGESFGDKLVGAVENLSSLHRTADSLAVQAATGELLDVHEYTIAATEAQLATELTVAVRDRAVSAFNEIMRMPI